MALKELLAKQVGLPNHLKQVKVKDFGVEANLFELTSHGKLRSALAFGLKLRREGFHIFVMGDERTNRMSATMSCLRELTGTAEAAKDWVYLNNFKAVQRPFAFALVAGLGQKLKGHMAAMLPSIQSSLIKTLEADSANDLFKKASASLEDDFSQQINKLSEEAKKQGFAISRSPEGNFVVSPLEENSQEEAGDHKKSPHPTPSQMHEARAILDQMSSLAQSAHMAQEALLKRLKEDRLALAKQIIMPYVDDLYEKFKEVVGFYDWVQLLKKDLISQFETLLETDDDDHYVLTEGVKNRYAVNVLVDHSSQAHMPIVTVSHASYENLFGSIKYKGADGGGMETDFTLIRPGALHKANGGILVIQAETLAGQPEVWTFLKRALHDREIVIEEFHRHNGTPMMQAPDPQPIPLDVQVVLVGAPWWFDDFFIVDPEFRTFFKVRAEIDLSMPACLENVTTFARLVSQWSLNHLNMPCDVSGVSEIMGHCSRWASNRDRLSGRFELIGDMLREARLFAQERGSKEISAADIEAVFVHRQQRKSAGFLQHLDEMIHNRLHIDTQGHVVGQVNALTVLTSVESSFGTASRVTARTFAAKEGVVSIERSIEMSGSIQDKGMMILTGYLNGTLGQHFPLTFGASLTFEQLYVPIDGDSASLAELIVLFSSLADLPVAQHIALTGSIDQLGNVQAVGGVHEKIEGFYALCKARGFTGEQGILLPEANNVDLTLSREVEKSIEKGEFHIWTVSRVEDAVPLMLGLPLGLPMVKRTKTSEDTVLNRVHKKLTGYVKLMKHD
jgi:predicted ATP-dependent protease